MSRTTFDMVQKEFCFPVIDDLWKDTLKGTWDKLRRKGNIVLAGNLTSIAHNNLKIKQLLASLTLSQSHTNLINS